MSNGNPSDPRLKFVELEYGYLAQSSFHCDELRDRFIQFYLLLVGAAVSLTVGLAPLAARSQATVPEWIFVVIPGFLGLLGLVFLPILARLRCLVIECLQGTVLLKRYGRQHTPPDDHRFASAFLWDETSVPTDERNHTASFALVLLFMVLNSGMFALTFAALAHTRLQHVGQAILWGLPLWSAMLTAEIVFYRAFLHSQLEAAYDDFIRKWDNLGAEKQSSPAASMNAQAGGEETPPLPVGAATNTQQGKADKDDPHNRRPAWDGGPWVLGGAAITTMLLLVAVAATIL
jgi:hypothetical protein